MRSVHGRSGAIRFVAAATRTPARARDFAAGHGLRLLPGHDGGLTVFLEVSA